MVTQGTPVLYRREGARNRLPLAESFVRAPGFRPCAPELGECELQLPFGRADHLARVVVAAALRQVNLSLDRLQSPSRSGFCVFEPSKALVS